MLELPHTLIGAAIATQVGNPLLALPLSLASHFVTDYIPHWNPHLYSETKKYGKPTKQSTLVTTGDSIVSLVVGVFIASQALPDTKRFLVILAACFFAVVPDVLEAPFFFLGIRPEWMEKWIDWQRRHQMRASFGWGMMTEAVVVVAALLVIFR